MRMAVVAIMVGGLETIPKEMVKNLEKLEITG